MFKVPPLDKKGPAAAVIMSLASLTAIIAVAAVDTAKDAALAMRARGDAAMLVQQMKTNQEASAFHLAAASLSSKREGFAREAAAFRGSEASFREELDTLLNASAAGNNRSADLAAAAKLEWNTFREAAESALQETEKELEDGASAAGMSASEAKANRIEAVLAANERTRQKLDALVKAAASDAGETEKLLLGRAGRATRAILCVTLLFVAVTLFLTLRITANLSRKEKAVLEALQLGAEGDLSARAPIDLDGPLRKAAASFNQMVQRFSETTCAMRAAVDAVNGSAGRVSEASREVLSAAETEAGTVSAASSRIIEVNGAINRVGANVDELAVLASETSASALSMESSLEEVARDTDTLSCAVEEVRSSILEIAASIRSISEASDVLMDQARSTVCSIDEMSGSIREVERNAMETAAISEAVRKDAQLGRQAVEDTITGIEQIRLASRATMQIIASLSSRAQDIGSIVSVINSVADQTNLLALNAAIIAAQAGEHGAGFAVVAGEIKQLADQTRTSTQEIAKLIKAVQEETLRAVQAIQDGEQCVAQGEELSQRSGEALAEIVSGVERASLQMGCIAKATEEQTRGSQMIREAFEHVAEMVSRIASATKEQTASVDLVTAAAERMKGLTDQVRLSTQEQSKVGLFIACSIENVTDRLQTIKSTGKEQSRGSLEIVENVGEISKSAAVTLEASRILGEAVSRFGKQVAALEKELVSLHAPSETEKQGDVQTPPRRTFSQEPLPLPDREGSTYDVQGALEG